MHQSRQYKEFAELLRKRTRRFALDVIILCRRFPRTIDGYVVARQLIKAATSTAANYRASCRSRTPSDFAYKIGVVCEEADESEFWLDVTIATAILADAEAQRLLREASELVGIFTASRDTAKKNLRYDERSRGTAALATLVFLAFMALLAFLALPARR